jgi:hypothetical protein
MKIMMNGRDDIKKHFNVYGGVMNRKTPMGKEIRRRTGVSMRMQTIILVIIQVIRGWGLILWFGILVDSDFWI